MKFDGSDLAELKKEAVNVEQILAGKVPPPALPDEDAIEATKDAVSEAEFQRARTLRSQATATRKVERRDSKRAGSASSLRRKASGAGGGGGAAAAAPAAALAAASARAPPAATSTTTEDVEAAAAPLVAAAAPAAPAAAAPAPPAPVIGPLRGNGDAV